ncbi:MAG: C40 family peptidase [Chlamydiia bacterium]|nr:C40 family peptidase [Chlamydiia bacterium]
MPHKHHIAVPVASLHTTPDSRGEVCTQHLYGQPVQVLENQKEWSFIETADPYRGWTHRSNLTIAPYAPNGRVTSLLAHVYAVKDTTPHPPLLTLSFDTPLQIIAGEDPRWFALTLIDGQTGWIHRGDVEIGRSRLSLEQMLTFSQRFQGLPYTWGGNSAHGYDCSAFVQMLYRQMGIPLPRDAKDQINSPHLQTRQGPPQPGDLLFFGQPGFAHLSTKSSSFSPAVNELNENMRVGWNTTYFHSIVHTQERKRISGTTWANPGQQKITHVALALSPSHFIHACVGIQGQPATIRISTLNESYFNERLAHTKRKIQR